jgi:5-enolpyruvylshikimate-3-phosphate synthase
MSVDDVSMVATSFPEFEELMRHLGAHFEAVEG